MVHDLERIEAQFARADRRERRAAGDASDGSLAGCTRSLKDTLMGRRTP